MTPKISEQFFRSLLAQSDALNATFAIAGFWSHRVDEAKPMFGLSRPEYYCQLVLNYAGEVGNGGHAQFFLNRGCGLVEDYVHALDAVSLPDLANALRQAEKFHAEAADLDAIDQQVWLHMPKEFPVLQRFLRENSEDILQRERTM